MYLVRIGYRTLNLEYLIQATDAKLGAPAEEAPAGGIRVSVYPGEQFDVGGDDAARLRVHLDDNLKPTPKGTANGDDQPPTRPKGVLPRGTRGSPKSRPQEE